MLYKYVKFVTIPHRIHYCTKTNLKNKLYSKTVLLPKTAFPLRLDSKKLVERDENINSVFVIIIYSHGKQYKSTF